MEKATKACSRPVTSSSSSSNVNDNNNNRLPRLGQETNDQLLSFYERIAQVKAVRTKGSLPTIQTSVSKKDQAFYSYLERQRKEKEFEIDEKRAVEHYKQVVCVGRITRLMRTYLRRKKRVEKELKERKEREDQASRVISVRLVILMYSIIQSSYTFTLELLSTTAVAVS